MPDDDDLHRSLRTVAERLDRAAPPLDADDVRAGRSQPQQRPAAMLVTAAVALVAVVGGGVVWQLVGGDGEGRDEVAVGDSVEGSFPAGLLLVRSLVVDDAEVDLGDTTPRVELGGDRATISASAGCNSFGAALEVLAGRLVLTSAGATQMGCAPHLQAIEEALFGLLGADPSWQLLDDGSIQLSTAAATVRLEVAPSESRLPSGTFVATSLTVDGEARPVRRLVIEIDAASNHATTRSGCDGTTGQFEFDGERLQFIDGQAFDADCIGPAAVGADHFAALLDATWERTADGLRLRDGDRAMMTFQPLGDLPTGRFRIAELRRGASVLPLAGEGVPAPTVTIESVVGPTYPSGGRVALSGSCRDVDLAYQVFDDVIATMNTGGDVAPACRTVFRHEDEAVSTILTGEPTWTVAGDALLLASGDLSVTLVPVGAPLPVPGDDRPYGVPLALYNGGDERSAAGYDIVERLVTPSSPQVVPTLDELVEAAVRLLAAGPTPAEETAGLSTVIPPDVIASVIRTGNLVTVDLDGEVLRASGTAIGTSTGTLTFHGVVGRTLFLLEGIDAIELQLDGSCEAYGEYVQIGGCPALLRSDLYPDG